MIEILVFVLGLCAGSFVNALVWRLHEQEKGYRGKGKGGREENKAKKSSTLHPTPYTLSIVNGRSMCPHCKHQLAAIDLVPVLSWLALHGRCRYCHKPISTQYPIVELTTGILFVLSFSTLHPTPYTLFYLWLFILTGLVALVVYDLRWMILPNKIIFPLIGLSMAYSLINIVNANQPASAFIATLWSLGVGAGIFYILFQVSNGKWIGGGDVKYGFIYGLILGEPLKSALVIFIGSLIGTLVILPSLLMKKINSRSRVPFGPMLITGTIIMVLYGDKLISVYTNFLTNLYP